MMPSPHHRFHELFAQLGLPSDDNSIRSFILEHSPLQGDVKLEDAKFWTPAQAQLLSEMLVEDADWAEVVDHLNAALRSVP
jgi:Protein of unknown function (DUF2789)